MPDDSLHLAPNGSYQQEIEAARSAIDRAIHDTRAVDLSWINAQSVNAAWAMPRDALAFLGHLIRAIEPTHVVEFGTGTSTELLLRESVSRTPRFKLSSIEHDPGFAQQTLRIIGAHCLQTSFSLSVAPLVGRVEFGRYAPFYHAGAINLATSDPADLILVDGPPGPLGGRLGALLQGLSDSRAGTIILMDDADRPGERDALDFASSVAPSVVEVHQLPGFERGLAAVVVLDPAPFRQLDHEITLSPLNPVNSPWAVTPSERASPPGGAQRAHGERWFGEDAYPRSIAVGAPNAETIAFLEATSCQTIAEIGIYHGATSEAIARFLNGGGELHLFDFDDRVHQVMARLHALGFSNIVGHGNSYKLLDSYNWSLMSVLEQHRDPIFDYVFIDGAHTWIHDGLAFLLVDRLLKPGGFIDFDDRNWTLAGSPSLRPSVFPLTAELYTAEQIHAPQIARVQELLVQRDPRYIEVIAGKVFQKRPTTSKGQKRYKKKSGKHER